jgi:hypothetical protein
MNGSGAAIKTGCKKCQFGVKFHILIGLAGINFIPRIVLIYCARIPPIMGIIAGMNRRIYHISGNEMSTTVYGLTLFIAYTQYGFDGFAISGIFHGPIDVLKIIKLHETIKRKFARLV